MDYQVYLSNTETGDIKKFSREVVRGLEDFMDSWEQSPETPQEFKANAWQGSDEQHPIGSGSIAYRVVYKTLKLIPFPSLVMKWPNLCVLIANGDVERGGMRTPSAIPGRNNRHQIIPEYGRVLGTSDSPRYFACRDLTMDIAGWEETVKAVSFVELIYIIEDPEVEAYEDVIGAGQKGTASLRTLLDLKLGPRLFAMPLAEEVGEVFDDWHWNRRIETGLFSVESQAIFRQLNGGEVANEIRPHIERNQGLESDKRRRISLACQWYWRADSDTDAITRFISWWLVVESLEMRKNSDIRPIRKRLAKIFESGEDVWGNSVGRLFGLRGKVVHGETSIIPKDMGRQVELLAKILLHSRLLDSVPSDLRDDFINTAKVRLVSKAKA